MKKHFPWFIPYFLLGWADWVGQRKGKGKCISSVTTEVLGSSAGRALCGTYKNIKRRDMSFLLCLYTSEVLRSWWLGPRQTELRRIWTGLDLSAFICWLQHCTQYQVEYQVNIRLIIGIHIIEDVSLQILQLSSTVLPTSPCLFSGIQKSQLKWSESRSKWHGSPFPAG